MFYLHHWHLPENSTMQLHVAKLPMKISVNKYFVRITCSASPVTPSLARPSGRIVHRACGGRSSYPAAVVDLAWGPHTRHGDGGGNLLRPISATRTTSTNQRTPQFWQCRLCVVSTSFQCCDDVVSIIIRNWINVNHQHWINVVSMLNLS